MSKSLSLTRSTSSSLRGAASAALFTSLLLPSCGSESATHGSGAGASGGSAGQTPAGSSGALPENGGSAGTAVSGAPGAGGGAGAAGASGAASGGSANGGTSASGGASSGTAGAGATSGAAGAGTGGSAGDASAGAAGTTAGTGGTAGSAAGSAGTAGASGGFNCPAPVNTLIGWATQGGGTTGGGNESPTTAGSASALEDALAGSDAAVVQFAGTLSGDFSIGSNKTLIGMGPDATIDGSIQIHDAENVIVRNVRVDAGSAEDGVSIQSSSRIWIDHGEVFDASDGNMDITDGSDYITVSWTIFRYSGEGEHNFSNLIASDDEDTGSYRVTFHHNWWGSGVLERMPRVRFGSVHVLNNFYGNGQGTNLFNDHCIRAAHESDVLVENNFFDHVATPHEIAEDNGTGVLTAIGNVYEASLNLDGNPASRGTAFDPPYEYAAEPAECVKASVMEGAGPQ